MSLAPVSSQVPASNPFQHLRVDDSPFRRSSDHDSHRSRSSSPASSHHKYYHTKPLPTPSRLQHAQTIVARYWLWEALACVFSLACFIAISAILQMTDGKQLDSWNLIIPPTAVVSFLAGLAKAALVLVLAQCLSQLKWIHYQTDSRALKDFRTFDEASRGPWGSAMLVFASRKWFGLATIAGILTVLALLVDPFIQLVFEFPTESVLDPTSQSAFATTRVWYPGRAGLNGMDTEEEGMDITGLWTPNATSWSGQAMTNNVYTIGSVSDDFYTSINTGFTGTIQPPLISCSSGNCTWDEPIQTLGVCGSCEDVTSSLTVNCTTTFDDYRRCGYTFPNGRYSELYVDALDWTVLNALTERLQNDNDLLRFSAVQLLVSMTEINVNSPQAKGWNCSLAWCEKTLAPVVASGKAALATIAEAPLHHIADLPDLTIPDFDGASNDLGIFQTNSSSVKSANYTLWHIANSQVKAWLGPQFQQAYASTVLMNHLTGKAQAPDRYDNTALPRALAYSTDLNKTINQVAAVLTEAVRTGPNNTEAFGRVWVEKSFIRVRWQWMALPLGLLFLTCVLFAAVTWRCHAVQAPIWKDDPVALLFHKIDNHDYAGSMSAIMPQHLRAMADELEVQMHRDQALVLKAKTEYL